MTFGCVLPPDFGGMLTEAVGLLAPACDRGCYAWDEVVADLHASRAQLWLTIEDRPVAAMVTRIDGDTLEIWLAGGAVLSGSVPHLETAIEASKAAGTTNGRIIGRRGWARVLRPYGWRWKGADLVKEWANEEKDRPE